MNSEEGRGLGNDQINKLSYRSITNSDEMLEAALINLDKFELIGIIVRLEHFQRDFESKFNFKLVIDHLNKNPAPTKKVQASENPEIREKVEQICFRDLILHHTVVDRLGILSTT